MNKKLKVFTFDPQIGKAIEGFLRTNYPEAELRWKGKRGDRIIMKRSSMETTTIRFVNDVDQNTTVITFGYIKWLVRGILYGRMGIWPTLIAQADSNGFVEDMADKLGKYLGLRFWARVECQKPMGFFSIVKGLIRRNLKRPYIIVRVLFKP